MQLYTLALLIFVQISIASANLVESREDSSFVTKNRKAEDGRKNQFIPFFQEYYEYYNAPQTQTRPPSTPFFSGEDIVLTIPPSKSTYVDETATTSITAANIYEDTSSPTVSPTVVDPAISLSTLEPSSTPESAQEYMDATSTSTSMPSSEPSVDNKSSMSPSSVPSSMPSSMPSLDTSNQSLALRGSSAFSNDHDTGINGKIGGDVNDNGNANDAKKPSSPLSSITLGLLSVGGLIAIFAGGLMTFKKVKGRRRRNNRQLEDNDVYPEIDWADDSDSGSDCSSDYGFDSDFSDFHESTEDVQFNIFVI